MTLRAAFKSKNASLSDKGQDSRIRIRRMLDTHKQQEADEATYVLEERLRTLRRSGQFDVAYSMLKAELGRGSTIANGWLGYMYYVGEVPHALEDGTGQTAMNKAVACVVKGANEQDVLSKAVYAKILFDRNGERLSHHIVEYLRKSVKEERPHYFRSIFIFAIYSKLIKSFSEVYIQQSHRKPQQSSASYLDDGIVIPHNLFHQLELLNDIELSREESSKGSSKDKERPSSPQKKAKHDLIVVRAVDAKKWLDSLHVNARSYLFEAVMAKSEYALALFLEFETLHLMQKPTEEVISILEQSKEPYAKAVLGRILFHNACQLQQVVSRGDDPAFAPELTKLYAKAWDCYDSAVTAGRPEFPFDLNGALKIFLSSRIIESDANIVKLFLRTIFPQCIVDKPKRYLSDHTIALLTQNPTVQKNALEYFLSCYGVNEEVVSQALTPGSALNQIFTKESLLTIAGCLQQCSELEEISPSEPIEKLKKEAEEKSSDEDWYNDKDAVVAGLVALGLYKPGVPSGLPSGTFSAREDDQSAKLAKVASLVNKTQ